MAARVAQDVVQGDLTGASAAVAASGEGGLNQMANSLSSPVGSSVVSVSAGEAGEPVRAVVQITDRVVTSEGKILEVGKRFLLVIDAAPEGAVVTAVYSVPGE